MGALVAPQWLSSAWRRTCLGAGVTASADAIDATGRALVHRWSEKSRHYHSLRHLIDVLARVDELAEETHEPDLVRLAAWYHGAVFDAEERAAYARRGGEDERASALLAREQLTDLGLAPERVERVVDLVTALQRHTTNPEDFDCAVLCDADLAVLAAEPQRYRAYLEDVRAEYAHLPLGEFVRARLAILRRLAARPRLYVSPLGAAWEEQARENIAMETQRLEKELARLAGAEAADAATSPGPREGLPSPGAPGHD